MTSNGLYFKINVLLIRRLRVKNEKKRQINVEEYTEYNGRGQMWTAQANNGKNLKQSTMYDPDFNFNHVY